MSTHATAAKAVQLAILTFIVAVSSMLLYAYIFLKIKDGSESIAALSSEIELEVLKEQRLLSTKSLVQDIETERKELDLYFVKEEEIVDFLEAVEGLGVETGTAVEIDTVNVEKADTSVHGDTPFEKLLLSVHAEGSWAGVYHVLTLIESMPYSLSVVSAKLVVAQGDASDRLWSGSFELVVDKLK